MQTNPFTELLSSGVILNEESIKRLREIEEIDKRIKFLDSIKIGKTESYEYR